MLSTPSGYEAVCASSSEGDLLLGKLGLVLLGDVQAAELVQLPLFNGLDLSAFLVNLLADLPAFLKVVKAVLL